MQFPDHPGIVLQQGGNELNRRVIRIAAGRGCAVGTPVVSVELPTMSTASASPSAAPYAFFSMRGQSDRSTARQAFMTSASI
jgi:hypothetical protein